MTSHQPQTVADVLSQERNYLNMNHVFHKPKPAVPKHYWYDTDGCWDCPSRLTQRACTNCRRLHKYNHQKDRANRHRNKQLLRKEYSI